MKAHPRARPGRPRHGAASTRSIDRAKQLGAAGLVWIRVRDGGALDSPVVKFLSEAEQLGLVDATGADRRRPPARRGRGAAHRRPRARRDPPRPRRPAGRRGRPALLLGRRLPAVRGDRRRRPPGPRAPPVHDAAPRRPRAARARCTARSCSPCARRPTTSCSTAGSSARAASGSTAGDIQQQIFALLGIDAETAQARFGFLLDAFRYGAPPHAGLRVRHRPARGDPRRRGEHPRGDRVPEDPVGRRPAHRRAAPIDRPARCGELAALRRPQSGEAVRRVDERRRSAAVRSRESRPVASTAPTGVSATATVRSAYERDSGERPVQRGGRGPARAPRAAGRPAAAPHASTRSSARSTCSARAGRCGR